MYVFGVAAEIHIIEAEQSGQIIATTAEDVALFYKASDFASFMRTYRAGVAVLFAGQWVRDNLGK